MDRAGRFLTLASLVSVLLCAIAVAMSARQYVRRHLDAVALLKTLGATRGFTLAVSLLQLVIVALLASLLGSVIGYVAQEWLLRVGARPAGDRDSAAHEPRRRWAWA